MTKVTTNKKYQTNKMPREINNMSNKIIILRSEELTKLRKARKKYQNLLLLRLIITDRISL